MEHYRKWQRNSSVVYLHGGVVFHFQHHRSKSSEEPLNASGKVNRQPTPTSQHVVRSGQGSLCLRELRETACALMKCSITPRREPELWIPRSAGSYVLPSLTNSTGLGFNILLSMCDIFEPKASSEECQFGETVLEICRRVLMRSWSHRYCRGHLWLKDANSWLLLEAQSVNLAKRRSLPSPLCKLKEVPHTVG